MTRGGSDPVGQRRCEELLRALAAQRQPGLSSALFACELGPRLVRPARGCISPAPSPVDKCMQPSHESHPQSTSRNPCASPAPSQMVGWWIADMKAAYATAPTSTYPQVCSLYMNHIRDPPAATHQPTICPPRRSPLGLGSGVRTRRSASARAAPARTATAPPRQSLSQTVGVSARPCCAITQHRLTSATA